MKAIHNFLIFIATTLLITSCTQQPIAIELNHLLKSMLYTQQHLAELSVSELTAEQLPRKHLLEQSYCDLIHRHVVYIQIASQCIGQCVSAKRLCNHCEQQAITCLTDTRPIHEKS